MLLVALFCLSLSAADDGSDGENPRSPLRRRLAERGIETGAALIAEGVAGRTRGEHLGSGGLGLLEVAAVVDERAPGVPRGGRISVRVQASFGDEPSSFIGDSQVASNIEAPEALRLYEAWYEQRWHDGRLGLLAGVHDYNAEFDLLDEAAWFVNSSFGIQPEISQVLPSTYPRTSLGVRLRARARHGGFVRAGYYRNDPGDVDDPLPPLGGRGGGFAGVEIGWRDPQPGRSSGKLALGAWRHDDTFTDFAATRRDSNGGTYLIGQRAWPAAAGPFSRVAAFVQLGRARRDRNPLTDYAGAGLTFGRQSGGGLERLFGVGVAHARSGRDYRRAIPGAAAAETAVELTVLFELRPGLYLQPDLQLIRHPGLRRDASTVAVAFVRLTAVY